MADDIKYGYAGSWSPRNGRKITNTQSTFSFGIFPWVPKFAGNNNVAKRGKVLVRVIGDANAPERAEDLARRITAALNDGRITAVDIVQTRFDSRSTLYDGWLLP